MMMMIIMHAVEGDFGNYLEDYYRRKNYSTVKIPWISEFSRLDTKHWQQVSMCFFLREMHQNLLSFKNQIKHVNK
jgi:hypothetical protein